MKFVLRLAGAAGVMATLFLSGCAMWSGGSEDPNAPSYFSDDYYDYYSNQPVGTRQVWRYGKLWPPFPRPTGNKLPWKQRYHAAHYWPYPYMCQDREVVRTFIQTHVDNGWILQTTLYDYHFNEETSELNQAGVTHLRWILGNAPEQYRTCWVQTGPTPAISELRVASVQAAAAEMVGPENIPQVALRADSPNGLPAQHIDTQYRKYLSTMREPRIQYEPPRSNANN